jgi:hypothetical protein
MTADEFGVQEVVRSAAIIGSAPSCIIHSRGQAGRRLRRLHPAGGLPECQGIMTFGPGSTYGEDGTGAAGSYMVLRGSGSS